MSATSLWQIFESLPQASEDDCIFAALPWTKNSEAMLVPTDELGNYTHPIPPGLKYFLEVAVCREVLEGFSSRVSIEKHFDLIVHYAIYDAFPEWAYE